MSTVGSAHLRENLLIFTRFQKGSGLQRIKGTAHQFLIRFQKAQNLKNFYRVVHES